MKKRLKQLGRDSLVYGLGSVLVKSIGIFLLPVYTRVFSPAEYGMIEMLTVISSFLSSILVMGMDSAQSFYFFKEKAAGKLQQKALVTAILQWRITWGLGIVLLATLFSPLLNNWLFGGLLDWKYFALAFVGALFTTVMGQSAEVFRLLYKPWPYIIIMMVSSVSSASIILTMVILFQQGIIGYFYGVVFGSLCSALFGWYWAREYLSFEKFYTSWWPKLLRFGLPLVPASLGMYVMNTADRWFIQHYHGADTLGLYAVAAKFALIMALAIETFRKAWWPIAMDAMHSDDGPETFRLIANFFIGLGVSGIILLTLLSPILIEWFTDSRFHSAWNIIGVLAWQSLFYGLFLVISAGIWKAEKTHLMFYLMLIAAAINIGLNYLLVPEWGNLGAALSTSLSFFGWVVIAVYLSEKLWPVKFHLALNLFQLLTGVSVVFWLIYSAETSSIEAKISVVLVAIILQIGILLSRLPKLLAK